MQQSIPEKIRLAAFKNNFVSVDKGQDLIAAELTQDKPSMIARFGSIEIKGLLYPRNLLLKSFAKERVFSTMHINAGFFPVNKDTLKQFSDLMIEDMKQLDILGSWRVEEVLLKSKLKQAKFLSLECLEPYFYQNPWSKALKGKDVLVIHPFTESIESQYRDKREKLFKNPDVLPEFKSLQTIKAVQTIAGNNNDGYSNWFEALDYMKSEIDKKKFDIAILGCGAYGFPLAAHIKRMGKKAVHLGGATQILFGIKGKRWIDRENFKPIINEHFIYPLDADIPANADKVENACYWK